MTLLARRPWGLASPAWQVAPPDAAFPPPTPQSTRQLPSPVPHSGRPSLHEPQVAPRTPLERGPGHTLRRPRPRAAARGWPSRHLAARQPSDRHLPQLAHADTWHAPSSLAREVYLSTPPWPPAVQRTPTRGPPTGCGAPGSAPLHPPAPRAAPSRDSPSARHLASPRRSLATTRPRSAPALAARGLLLPVAGQSRCLAGPPVSRSGPSQAAPQKEMPAWGERA